MHKTNDSCISKRKVDVFIMITWNFVDKPLSLSQSFVFAALEKARPGKVGIYNVGTGRGRSVKEFVEVCKAATRVPIKVDFLPRRPGDYAEVYSDPTKIQNELNWSQIH
ncbi:hypothetical protein FXO38_13365 [Capsicum annuum]|nr:hypothetical protein FXO38_13365 [Capsicum annuum]